MGGIELNPIYDGKSTAMMKAVVMASLKEGGETGQQYAKEVESEKDWRHGYPKHYARMWNLLSGPNLKPMANAALGEAYKSFTINGKPINEMSDTTQTFKTRTVKGEGEIKDVSLPYKGKNLSGNDLTAQVKKWNEENKLESSGVEAIEQILPKLKDAKIDSSKWFVILGAGSALGPTEFLLSRGANVIALRTRRPNEWKALEERTRKEYTGTLHIPTEDGTIETAGVDLLQEPFRALTWIKEVLPSVGADVTVGFYIYLDGVKHVQVTMTCDLIMMSLHESHNARLAYIGSPSLTCPLTTTQATSADAVREQAPWYIRWTGCPASPRDVVDKSEPKFYLTHNYSLIQGPNYALAKSLQNMRALMAEKVSFQYGPICRSESVMKNATMAKVVNSTAYIPNQEAYECPTASVMLGLLLLNDVVNDPVYEQPMDRLMTGNFHGGALRNGFNVENSKALSAILLTLGTMAPLN